MQQGIIGLFVGITISLIGFIIYDKTNSHSSLNMPQQTQNRVLPHYSLTYDPNANPHLNTQEAILNAKKHNKKLLIVVGNNKCTWSGEWDRFVMNNPKIYDVMYKNYEIVKVYYDPRTKNQNIRSFLSQLPKGPGTPHFYVIDTNKKLLVSKKSADMEQGFSYSPQKVLDFLNKYKAH